MDSEKIKLTKEDVDYIKNNSVNRLELLVKYFLHTYKNRLEMTGEEMDKMRGYQQKVSQDLAVDLERYFNDKQ